MSDYVTIKAGLHMTTDVSAWFSRNTAKSAECCSALA